MGTKPMVFPLDVNGHVYVLHNEMDEPVCTGSRETCYRLLEIMLEVKRRADENELKIAEQEEELARAAAAAATTTNTTAPVSTAATAPASASAAAAVATASS